MMAKLAEAGFDYCSPIQEALSTAIHIEDIELVPLCLENGADPEGDAWHGRRFNPPLLEAARQHNKPLPGYCWTMAEMPALMAGGTAEDFTAAILPKKAGTVYIYRPALALIHPELSFLPSRPPSLIMVKNRGQ
ncbi:MAG: hypothetical protein J6P53_02215 [Mailhella sp.]|nr:hypothetical protein [Mailhella sp.]